MVTKRKYEEKCLNEPHELPGLWRFNYSSLRVKYFKIRYIDFNERFSSVFYVAVKIIILISSLTFFYFIESDTMIGKKISGIYPHILS